jgi:DNA-binding transcriptional MocR family regulator
MSYGQYVVPKSDQMINFGVGQPNNDILPMELIKSGMQDLINHENDKSIIQYGVKQGYKSFRSDLATFMSRQLNAPVDETELFVTNGVTGALNLICSILGKKTIILVEESTYFLALNIFRDYGYEIIMINFDRTYDKYIDQITNVIKTFNNDSNIGNIVLYTIPTFHNPTNFTMPDKIRHELIALSQKHTKFTIIADEVYQYLYFNESDKPSLPLHYYVDKTSTNQGKIFSVGSFSKILAPGLRLGWIQTSSGLIEKLNNSGTMESAGALNVISSRIVQPLLNDGSLDEYIKSCRVFLRTRGEFMFECLSKHLSEYCEFEKPTGGYFIWIKLKHPKMNTKLMLDIAIKNKVRYHFGEKFSSASSFEDSDKPNHFLRLSFSWYDVQDIEIGILRLKQTIQEYLESI